jgi:exodeoxyribonuclease V alpha subunit
MVSLPMLAKLLAALAPKSRLILLGDRDQLASVEAGAVLGDICATGEESGYSAELAQAVAGLTGEQLPVAAQARKAVPLRDSVVVLRTSYRFQADSGIGAVSRLVNEGGGDAAIAVMEEGGAADCTLQPLPPPEQLAEELRPLVREAFGPCLQASGPAQALELLGRFRILAALRQGPYGVETLNRLIEEQLASGGLIAPTGRWYAGRPVMIARNDYSLGLFNGDVGIIWPDGASGELRAFFPAPDGGVRRFLPLRLPEHETVFAMTVHKSQGSEFDRVLLVLTDQDVPVVSRELIYTALTRARQQVSIWAGATVFRQAVARRVKRSSGLRELLWGGGRPEILD